MLSDHKKQTVEDDPPLPIATSVAGTVTTTGMPALLPAENATQPLKEVVNSGKKSKGAPNSATATPVSHKSTITEGADKWVGEDVAKNWMDSIG